MPIPEIEELKRALVAQLDPLRLYLFGSFAEGRNTQDSDLDLYIVVEDDAQDLAALTTAAYRAVRKIKKRPVDIVVGRAAQFETRKLTPFCGERGLPKGNPAV